jgi:hypothetical protein
MSREKWYHGGPGSLAKILPPTITHALGQEYFGNNSARRDRIYLVNSYPAAALYAGAWPDGVVYEVVPEGDLEADTDFCDNGDATRSMCCASARIVGRHRLTAHDRRIVRLALGVAK